MRLPLNLIQKIAKEQGSDSMNIWQTSLIEKYWARPDSDIFRNMCLAEFASNYSTVSRATTQRDSDDEDVNVVQEDDLKVIELLDNKGMIKKRKVQAVIRYYKVSKVKDAERYLGTILRMYFPHRGANFKPDDTTFEYFHDNHTFMVEGETVTVKDFVCSGMNRFEGNVEIIEDAWENVQQNVNLEAGQQ